jgi:hypothetical protein
VSRLTRFRDNGVVSRRSVARKLERAVLGAVMSMIAFIIERRVLKAFRGAGRAPIQATREGEFAPGGNGPAESA